MPRETTASRIAARKAQPPETTEQREVRLYREGMAKKPTKKRPLIRTMERWAFDGIARATDGCKVEPDGRCHHGHLSWLVYLGYC